MYICLLIIFEGEGPVEILILSNRKHPGAVYDTTLRILMSMQI